MITEKKPQNKRCSAVFFYIYLKKITSGRSRGNSAPRLHESSLRRCLHRLSLDLPSAGSAFKRPVGGYAAALIDQAGLKGFCVGGAGVSTKHAGFVVNNGGATAEDVKNVLQQVAQKVYENSGIRLEPEVRIW